MKLTENQQLMLRWLYLGDSPSATVDGYFWQDDPRKRFDLRTARSLIQRGLLTTGLGVQHYGMLRSEFYLTNEGEAIAAVLDEGG